MLPSTRISYFPLQSGLYDYRFSLSICARDRSFDISRPSSSDLRNQVVHDCPEPTLGPSCCLGSPPKVVIAAGQQVARISRAGQRRGMRSVVSCPCRLPRGSEGGVEVIG